MASSGEQAWTKYFQGKTVETKMKKDSALMDINGKSIGKTISAGTKVTALNSSTYRSEYPINIEGSTKVYYVTFNNIAKPVGGSVTGIKLKPQNFKSIVASPSNISATDLAKSLISDLNGREDLPEDLVEYLVELTKYYGGVKGASELKIKKAYSSTLAGLNSVQTDYGEMLGAMACITKGISKINFGANPKITFPIRGNEPIVDYYIKTRNAEYSFSAKSGDTTNTLKPGDILSLLQSKGLTSKWARKQEMKLVQLADESSIASFPFKAINLFYPGTLNSAAISEVDSKFKAANFSSKNYESFLFNDLFDKIGVRKIKGKFETPTIGKLYYDTESFIVKTANEQTNPDALFKDATSGLVTYVKFKLDNDGLGIFEVKTSDVLEEKTPTKSVKWRCKNSQNRASDKIGLQP